MESKLKSISHAMIAHGIHIYMPSGTKNYVIGNRLVCTECGEPWFMNFTECFICGAFYLPLHRCANCKAFNSITGATGKCSNCGKVDTLHLECPNPDCLSNTNRELHNAINHMGGVFSKNSGFRISLQRCLNCGSQYHLYQTRKIHVFSTISTKVDKTELKLDVLSLLRKESFIIFRIQKANELSYSLLSEEQYSKTGTTFDLLDSSNDLGQILDLIFRKINY